MPSNNDNTGGRVHSGGPRKDSPETDPDAAERLESQGNNNNRETSQMDQFLDSSSHRKFRKGSPNSVPRGDVTLQDVYRRIAPPAGPASTSVRTEAPASARDETPSFPSKMFQTPLEPQEAAPTPAPHNNHEDFGDSVSSSSSSSSSASSGRGARGERELPRLALEQVNQADESVQSPRPSVATPSSDDHRGDGGEGGETYHRPLQRIPSQISAFRESPRGSALSPRQGIH